MDVDGLERAERLLDLGKRLVGADGCGIAENPFGQVGAHHVEAVKRRLGRDGIGLAAERKGRLADVEFEVLGHLVAVDDGADLEANLVFAAQRLPGARDGGGDDGEIAFGRGQQVETLAVALGGEFAVAADDEPLARIIGRGDRRHVAPSNSDSCNSPASTSARMAGARSAVIQSRPAGAMSSSMRICVIMPRSPTSTTCLRAKRALILSICAARVAGSPVSPSNTSIATGQPSGAHIRP